MTMENEELVEMVCEVIERDQQTGRVGRTRTRGLGKITEFRRLPPETPVREAPVLERHDERTIAGVSLEHGEEWHRIDVGDDDFHVACLMKDIVLGRMHSMATKRRSMIVKHIDRYVDSRRHILTRIYRTYEDDGGDGLSLTWRYYSPIALCEWWTAVRLPADATMEFAERYLSEAYRPPAPSGDGVVLRGWSEDMAVRMDAASLLTERWDHLEGIADRAERLATETRPDGNRLEISEWRLESLPALRAALDRAVEEGMAERTCEKGIEMWRSKR